LLLCQMCHVPFSARVLPAQKRKAQAAGFQVVSQRSLKLAAAAYS
jgi:hypothetical protein